MTITPTTKENETKKIWYVEAQTDSVENNTPITAITEQYYTTDIDDAIAYVKEKYDDADVWRIEEIDLADL